MFRKKIASAFHSLPLFLYKGRILGAGGYVSYAAILQWGIDETGSTAYLESGLRQAQR
jgi:hypothetical protein